MLGFIVAAVISYVLGSIPNGLLLGKGIWGVVQWVRYSRAKFRKMG